MRYLAIILTIVCASVSIPAQDKDQVWGAEKEKALSAQMASQVRNRTTSLGLERLPPEHLRVETPKIMRDFLM
jgi:hypothetical protein